MTAVRTDYLLRVPVMDELRHIFGSLDYAYRVSGGDIPTLCFYLANPDRIPDIDQDWQYAHAGGAFAAKLREAATEEVVIAAFRKSGAGTIAAVHRDTGKSRAVIRRALVANGLWPAEVRNG